MKRIESKQNTHTHTKEKENIYREIVDEESAGADGRWWWCGSGLLRLWS